VGVGADYADIQARDMRSDEFAFIGRKLVGFLQELFGY
jgi:hypothetical protein